MKPPEVDPAAAARAALAEFDANKDGFLDAAELERCPSLKGALRNYDKNSDGKISAGEIAGRLRMFKESNTGSMSVSATVTMGDSPLGQANVRLVPEKFLGDAIKPASGVTDALGQVALKIEGDHPGVYCGLYRIEVSKKGGDGKEQIPARYNAQTTLGYEVAPDVRGGGQIILRLQGL